MVTKVVADTLVCECDLPHAILLCLSTSSVVYDRRTKQPPARASPARSTAGTRCQNTISCCTREDDEYSQRKGLYGRQYCNDVVTLPLRCNIDIILRSTIRLRAKIIIVLLIVVVLYCCCSAGHFRLSAVQHCRSSSTARQSPARYPSSGVRPTVRAGTVVPVPSRTQLLVFSTRR